MGAGVVGVIATLVASIQAVVRFRWERQDREVRLEAENQRQQALAEESGKLTVQIFTVSDMEQEIYLERLHREDGSWQRLYGELRCETSPGASRNDDRELRRLSRKWLSNGLSAKRVAVLALVVFVLARYVF